MIESLESENNQLQERIHELEQIQATALEVDADAAANSMIGLLRAENEQHQEHIEELDSRIEDQQSRIDELEESAAGAPVGGEPDGLGLAGAVIENLETENNQQQEHIHELETELRSRDASPRPASMADEDALATVMIDNLAQDNQQLHKQLDILHRESESMGSATGGAVDDTAGSTPGTPRLARERAGLCPPVRVCISQIYWRRRRRTSDSHDGAARAYQRTRGHGRAIGDRAESGRGWPMP